MEELVPAERLAKAVATRVFLPPSYEAEPERRFPVLYFLHDNFGDETELDKQGVTATLAAEMRAGRLPEFLIVSPRGIGTWFVDSYDGRVPYGTFLTRDLVPFVDGRYRTAATRSGRAVSGVSMGGYGAFRWALDEPGLFAAAGALSPAVLQLTWRSVESLPFFLRPALRGVFGSDPVRNGMRANDIYDIFLSRPELAKRAPPIHVRVGREDRYRLPEICGFLRRFLDAMGVPNTSVVEPGIHDWPYWSAAYPKLAASLAGHFSAGAAP